MILIDVFYNLLRDESMSNISMNNMDFDRFGLRKKKSVFVIIKSDFLCLKYEKFCEKQK